MNENIYLLFPSYLFSMVLSKNLVLAHDIRLMAQHANFSNTEGLKKFENWVQELLDSNYPSIKADPLDEEGFRAIEEFLKARQQPGPDPTESLKYSAA